MSLSDEETNYSYDGLYTPYPAESSISKNEAEISSLLERSLKKKASILCAGLDTQDGQGNTLLHYALMNDHTKVVRFILNKDDIAFAVSEGELPLTQIANVEGFTPLNYRGALNPLTNDCISQYETCFAKKQQARRHLERQSAKTYPEHSAALYTSSSLSPSPYSTTESIIPKKGTGIEPKWKDAACTPQYNWLSKATGQLVWKDLSESKTLVQNVSAMRWGSGCLIADNLFLTAGHCFDVLNDDNGNLSDALTNSPLNPVEFVSLMTVSFNYELMACPVPESAATNAIPNEKVFNIRRLVEHRLGGLDYAILELEGLPGKEFGTVRLSKKLPSEGKEVVIAQHPSGQVKKVHSGPIVCEDTVCYKLGDSKIYYGVDTMPGSSGSAVALPEDKVVVGVHVHGFSGAQIHKANSAVSIRAISEVSRVLSESTFGFFKPRNGSETQNNETPQYRHGF